MLGFKVGKRAVKFSWLANHTNANNSYNSYRVGLPIKAGYGIHNWTYFGISLKWKQIWVRHEI